MISDLKNSGFVEVEHTADWAIRVWAPDITGLLAAAAGGMYALMGIRPQPGGSVRRACVLQGEDHESLMVTFLSELLYYLEVEWLVFDRFELTVQGRQLNAVLVGLPCSESYKEIKAVTYHQLQIIETERGLETLVVFDV